MFSGPRPLDAPPGWPICCSPPPQCRGATRAV